jgi:hypothetical protein
MKRGVGEIESPIPPLYYVETTVDVMGELARWVSVESVRDIYAFRLVCRNAEVVLPVLLDRWVVRIHDKQVSPEISIMMSEMGRRAISFKDMTIETKDIPSTVFRIQVYSLLAHNWLRKSGGGRDRCVARTVIKAPVGELFYYDKDSKKASPLMELPITVLSIDGDTRKALYKLIDDKMGVFDSIGRLAKSQVPNIKEKNLVSHYYNIAAGTNLEILSDPLPSDCISRVIIGGRCLSDFPEVYNNLYFCNYKREMGCVDHNKCKSYILELQKMFEDGMDAIIKKWRKKDVPVDSGWHWSSVTTSDTSSDTTSDTSSSNSMDSDEEEEELLIGPRDTLGYPFFNKFFKR